ncbi:hypothetical protein T01_837, partial [Trichinella spiralis]
MESFIVNGTVIFPVLSQYLEKWTTQYCLNAIVVPLSFPFLDFMDFLENCKISWAIDLLSFEKRQHRTKLYRSEISKKLFPEYHDRISTERTCSNVYILTNFSIDIDLLI